MRSVISNYSKLVITKLYLSLYLEHICEKHPHRDMHVSQECGAFKGSYHNFSSPYFSGLYFFCFNSLVAIMIVFGWRVICPMTEVNVMQPQQRLCSSLDVRPSPLPALS